MDFGSVENGGCSHRTITLENHSAAPVHFQFITDEVRYFEWQQPRAVCNANRSILLHCNFRPTETANYYKRILIIVQDQYPLFIDVMGTGYKVALRSATILPHHVYEHRENLKLIVAEREMARVLKKDVSELAAFRDDDEDETAAMYFDPMDIFYGDPTDDTKDDPPEWSWLETPSGQHMKFRNSGMRSPGASSGALANMLLDAEAEEGQVFGRPHEWDIQISDNNGSLVMYHRQEATGRVSAFECWEEFFMGRMVDWDPVTVSTKYLDFGLGKTNVETPEQVVYVKNNLADPVTVMWLVPWEFEHPHVASYRAKNVASRFEIKSKVKECEQSRTVFNIMPEKIIIPAGVSVPFSITFKPTQVDMFYYQLISCFAWTSTSYHVVPCWSSTLHTSGNTFQDRTHIYLPLASLSTHDVIFPPAAKGTSVFQNIMIYNHDANTPLRYHWMSEHLPAEFRMKPSHGLVPPKDFNIISFRFDAGEPKVSLGRVVVHLNDSVTTTMQVNLTATSHIAKVRSEKWDQAVCFKPTSIGTQAILNISIINSGAIPANFEWQVPEKCANIFCITPEYGLLKAGEKRSIAISFFPKRQKLYYCNVHCLYAAFLEKAFVQDNTHLIEGVTSCDVDEFLLVVTGTGITQSISITPGKVDYGTVLTGVPHKQDFKLYNPSVGNLRFLLECDHGPRVSHDSFHLVLDCYRGILRGGTTCTITATLHPTKAQFFNFKITCKTFLPPKDLSFEDATFQKLREVGGHETLYDESDKALEFVATCSLVMNAIHPVVQVVDARAHGLSAPQFFRTRLIRNWNREMKEGKIVLRPNGEVVYQELFCLGALIEDSPEDFVLDFGVRQLGTSSIVVWLALQSGTALPVSWRFRLWNDVDIDVENWVVEAPPTDHESDLLVMRPNFRIDPRKGKLEPGETTFVKFTYLANIEGRHDFPAILQITDGRSVHFYLRGTTIAMVPHVLIYQPDTHFLKSQVVGDVNPPIQTTDLINTGTLDMKYELDMTPLVQMQKNNHGFRVLWCLNPTGIIPPQQSILVHWLFQPLEAKTYSAEIPVYVESGEGGVLKIEGRGRRPCESYDPASTDGNPPRMTGTPHEWPGLPATLSSYVLEFGTVEELSTTKKLVGLQNRLPDTPIAYWWRKSEGAEHQLEGRITVEPERGVLDPGKRLLCKVEFLAAVRPQLFETTLHLEINVLHVDPENSMTIGSSTPTEVSSEIIIDTWPKELGSFMWNKNFQHRSVLNLSTIASRSKVSELALQKLAANPYLHFNERMDDEVVRTPPAVNFVLYLTVLGQIEVKHFHPTTEDLLSAEDKLPWTPQERSDIEVQFEFVNDMMLQLLQEALHDETHDETFTTLDTGKQLCFEEFQQEYPRPLTEDEVFAAMFMSLGEGELHPQPAPQRSPDEPKPSLFVNSEGQSLILKKAWKPPDSKVPRSSALIRAVGAEMVDGEEDPASPDHSFMAALAETAEVVLEDALFSVTAEMFEAEDDQTKP
ncbi:cilia- and flagella-associated protein 65 isoform X3 [Physcomitrium patens]